MKATNLVSDYFEMNIKILDKDFFNFFSAAQSYFDVALAEVEMEIEFSLVRWPVCLPKLASLDLDIR